LNPKFDENFPENKLVELLPLEKQKKSSLFLVEKEENN
jgi:hypothetical protein